MTTTAAIRAVPITELVPDSANLREHFEPEDIEALGRNLLEQGQLDPIQVFERGDGTYDLYDGERRWRAAQLVGLDSLQAIVVERPSAEDLICKKVSRALQTRNLTPQEELAAIQSALEALGIQSQPSEWTKAARRLGIPVGLLRDRMKLTKLADPVRREFEKGDLDLSAAQAIGRIEDKNRQQEVATFVQDNNLNTRFVGTKFIKHLTQNPTAPVMEAYTSALAEERGMPSISKSKDGEDLTSRLNNMLADLRRSIVLIEGAGREDWVSQLTEQVRNGDLERLAEGVGRLGAICQAFMKHAQSNGSSDTLLRLGEPEVVS
jgi:ParB/RepB/Spo0J family partition protein